MKSSTDERSHYCLPPFARGPPPEEIPTAGSVRAVSGWYSVWVKA